MSPQLAVTCLKWRCQQAERISQEGIGRDSYVLNDFSPIYVNSTSYSASSTSD